MLAIANLILYLRERLNTSYNYMSFIICLVILVDIGIYCFTDRTFFLRNFCIVVGIIISAFVLFLIYSFRQELLWLFAIILGCYVICYVVKLVNKYIFCYVDKYIFFYIDIFVAKCPVLAFLVLIFGTTFIIFLLSKCG